MQKKPVNTDFLKLLVRPSGFEPPTPTMSKWRSMARIPLIYNNKSTLNNDDNGVMCAKKDCILINNLAFSKNFKTTV